MIGKIFGEQQENPEPLFGKKFLLRGGIFMGIIIALALYRHYTMDVPFGMAEEEKTEQEAVDTLISN